MSYSRFKLNSPTREPHGVPLQGPQCEVVSQAPLDEQEEAETAKEERKKRSRASGKHQMGACTRCKLKRRKCDGKYPKCSLCESAGVDCTVFDYTTERVIPRNYIQILEERIERLESMIKETGSPLSEGNQTFPHSKDSGNRYGRPTDEDNFRKNPRPLEMEVGYITLGASADSSYIGNSSAFSIAKAITQSIDYYNHKDTALSEAMLGSLDPKRNRRFTQTNPHLELEMGLSFSTPPLALAKYYLKMYKDIVQIQYPFMEWGWVLKAFDNVMLHSSQAPDELFFIYMIFAIGTQLSSYTLSTSCYTKIYYKKAMESLGPLVEGTSLKTVQVYLILSMFSQKMPEGSSIWQVSGLAIRSATILGLHREPFWKEKENPDPEVQKLIQLRARIFWSAYGIERINGIVLGRPFGISDSDIDVSLPEETPEILLGVHVTKVRRIQLKICAFVYLPVKPLESSDEVDAIRVQITLELNEWKQNFPIKAQPSSAFETKNWCEVTYHNSFMLLLRPVVLQVSRLKKDSSPRSLEWFKVFAQSASAICINYKILVLKNKLNYTWLTLHCAFVTGLSFLYCLWIDNFIEVLSWKRKGLIYDTISSCSQVLFVFAEKFPSTAAFRDTFEKVANVVLLKLESKKKESPNSGDQDGIAEQSSDSSETFQSPLGPVPNMSNGIINEESLGIDQYLGFNETFHFEDTTSTGAPPDHPITAASTSTFNETIEEMWEFLDSKGDKFLRDIFSDMEKQLGLQ